MSGLECPKAGRKAAPCTLHPAPKYCRAWWLEGCSSKWQHLQQRPCCSTASDFGAGQSERDAVGCCQAFARTSCGVTWASRASSGVPSSHTSQIWSVSWCQALEGAEAAQHIWHLPPSGGRTQGARSGPWPCAPRCQPHLRLPADHTAVPVRGCL